MTDAELNFKACIESLEKFNSEYIQANKLVLGTRSLTQIPSTPGVVSAGPTVATSVPAPVILNDYGRMCRMYCVMLWTYWDALGIACATLDEVKLVRNCLVHHEGDMARYSQSQNPKWAADGTRLISITNGKPYVQGYSLVIGDQDLINFTNLVKQESLKYTGVIF